MRSWVLLALLALASPVGAGPADAEAAFRRVEALLAALEDADAVRRPRLEERLDEACGAFVAAHLAEAAPERLATVAAAWLHGARRRGDLDALARRLDRLEQRAPLPPAVQRRVRLERGRLAVVPGATAPRWTGDLLGEAKPLRSEDLRGRVTLLHTWDPANPASRAFVATKLAPLRRRAAELEVVALAEVGADVPDDALRTEAQAQGLTWRIVRDPGGELALAHGATTRPFVCLLDAAGVVLAVGPGWEQHGEVTAAVGRTLAPASPPSEED